MDAVCQAAAGFGRRKAELHGRVQASALAHEVAGNRMGAAQSMDAPLGLQRHLTVPLFATSAVTGSGIPLLHAFLASLRSTAQPAASALVRHHLLACHAVSHDTAGGLH